MSMPLVVCTVNKVKFIPLRCSRLARMFSSCCFAGSAIAPAVSLTCEVGGGSFDCAWTGGARSVEKKSAQEIEKTMANLGVGKFSSFILKSFCRILIADSCVGEYMGRPKNSQKVL